jgi:hypothetical protein
MPRSRRHSGYAKVFLDVSDLLHLHQSCCNPRGRANELKSALDITESPNFCAASTVVNISPSTSGS